MLKSIRNTLSDCIELIKLCVEDYHEYKREEAQFKAETEKFIANNMKQFEEECAIQRAEDERQLNENIVYDNNTNLYYFETTAEYNGVPHTFRCSEGTKDGCIIEARFMLTYANMYRRFGIY